MAVDRIGGQTVLAVHENIIFRVAGIAILQIYVPYLVEYSSIAELTTYKVR